MPLTSCQSSMTLAAGAKVQKLITSPFIMRAIATNIAQIPINTLCNFACMYFPLALLGAPGPIFATDISPYSIS